MKLWMVFVLLTVVCWGAYVPTIHAGQKAIGGRSAGLWAFTLVGVAYFLVAVLAPLGLLALRGELASIPPVSKVGVGLFAGALGAVGALGVILALMNGGTPLAVPPLVFAGAPIVATIIGMALHRPANAPSALFYIGILMAAAGAALVLRYRPG
jgi:hypothetical protein